MRNGKVWQGSCLVVGALVGGLSGWCLDAFRQTVGHHFHQPCRGASSTADNYLYHGAGHSHSQS